MPRKLNVVKITLDEREELESVVKRGCSPAWKVQRAQALLQCDQGEHGPGWTDEDVASAYGCTTRSLERAQASGRIRATVAVRAEASHAAGGEETRWREGKLAW